MYIRCFLTSNISYLPVFTVRQHEACTYKYCVSFIITFISHSLLSTNFFIFLQGKKINQGPSIPRSQKFSLDLWKFSDSSPAGYWNLEYFACIVSCWAPEFMLGNYNYYFRESSWATAAKILSLVSVIKGNYLTVILCLYLSCNIQISFNEINLIITKS
jgi:hypothetical protein